MFHVNLKDLCPSGDFHASEVHINLITFTIGTCIIVAKLHFFQAIIYFTLNWH